MIYRPRIPPRYQGPAWLTNRWLGSSLRRLLDRGDRASVTLANESTGETRATVSGSAGVYVFPSLAPGTYRIDAELPGFQRTVRRGIELAAGQKLGVDLTLEIGNVQQSIEGTASAAPRA